MVHGLSCSAACGIFLDQGLHPCPGRRTGRRILNHSVTREVPHITLRADILKAFQDKCICSYTSKADSFINVEFFIAMFVGSIEY